MAELSRLPVPVADVWEWQVEGACRSADPQVFFHPEGERGPARRKRDAAAVAICDACPVMERCRQHGLAVREPYGVWGGLTEDDREAMYLSDRRPEREPSHRREPRQTHDTRQAHETRQTHETRQAREFRAAS